MILKKLILAPQIIFYLILIETLIFFSVPMAKNVKILGGMPVYLKGFSNEYVISAINTILYKNFLGMHLFVANCIRYSLLGFLFLSKRIPVLRVALGVKKSNGRIQGHMWLENCTSVMFEPAATSGEYKKLGEFYR